MTETWEHFRSKDGYLAIMGWYQRALKRVATSVSSSKVQTRFGETHLLQAGPEAGPVVVMLPGWGANAAIFFGQIEALAAEGYRVVAIDTIGQAGKSAPVHLQTENDEYALWLSDVFDQAAIERAHLVGITGGAWLALRFAAHTSQRVKSLALISPMGIAGYKLPSLKTIVLLIAFGILPIQPMVRPYMRLHVSKESELSDFAGEMLRLFFRHYKVFSLPWPSVLPATMLGGIEASSLVLFAEDDVYFEPESAAEAARLKLEHAQVEIIEDMGHLMIFDQPERVNIRLLRFFSDIDSEPKNSD